VEQLEQKFEKWTSYSQGDEEEEVVEEGEEIYDINTTPNSPVANASVPEIPKMRASLEAEVTAEVKNLVQSSSSSLPH